MGLFDDSEKKKIEALEFQINNLRIQLDRKDSEWAEKLGEASFHIQNRDNTIADLTARLKQYDEMHLAFGDAPPKNLSAIHLLVRILGMLLILASLGFANSLARAVLPDGQYYMIWGLYLFSQFSGLYLTGFGTPTTLRSITAAGIYMSVLLVVIASAIVVSLTGMISLHITRELIYLAVINALGVPTLIYVERKTSVNLDAVHAST